VNTARRHPRLATWLALVAMAALTLLPTLTHALARAAGQASAGYAEVCTPQGTKLVALAEGEQVPPSAGSHLEHCPYCAAGAALSLPAMAAALPTPVDRSGAPPPALRVPGPAAVWSHGRPRGPPTTA